MMKRYSLLPLLFLLVGCGTRKFTVDDVTKKQVFIVKKRAILQGPLVIASVTVRVKGTIDGRAVVFITNSPANRVDHAYPIRFRTFVDREISQELMYRNQFSVIYQPLTAKSGHVEIEVDAP